MKVQLAVLAALVAASGGVYYGLHRGSAGSGDEPASAMGVESAAEPAVTVEVAPLAQGSVSTGIEMLGTVTSIPGALVSRSLPGEAMVVRVLVAPGQHVDADTPVLELGPSPAMAAQVKTAEENLRAERKSLAATQERVDGKLGTRSDLLAAERALRSAELQLQNLRALTPPEDGLIRSTAKGTVSAVLTSEGATVAGGTPLFQVVPDESLAIRFGIPPRALGSLSPGDSVDVVDLLSGVEHSTPVTIERVDSSVNPLFRTVAAWSAPVDAGTWILGTPVRITAMLQSPTGFVVPRTALVLDGDRPGIFTVDQERATRHDVIIVGENASSVCVKSREAETGLLEPGMTVAVSGVYELSDGALVQAEAAH